MKKLVLCVFSSVFLTIIGWQYSVLYFEPKVIEILPVKESSVPVIDPLYPEPVRIVFDKEIPLGDITYSIQPAAKVSPVLRKVRLRNVKLFSDALYPAFVLNNNGVLKQKTTYTVEVKVRRHNIFDFLFTNPIRVQFHTAVSDGKVKKETGAEMDKRLFGK